MLQLLLIGCATILFFTLERLCPGRTLPSSPGWYWRVLVINAVQLSLTILAGFTWNVWLQDTHFFDLRFLESPILEGFITYLVGTFIFYWWHRIRHLNGWWVIFHQVHHSPSRIETLTSFYKHPVEILANSLLTALVAFALLGVSLEAAAWFNVFAAIGEYFYHTNLRIPQWVGYFIQTPQLHSIHHQLDVHNYNFSDLPIWDRLFGTYKATPDFAPQCGFPRENERKLGSMLLFRDVYNA